MNEQEIIDKLFKDNKGNIKITVPILIKKAIQLQKAEDKIKFDNFMVSIRNKFGDSQYYLGIDVWDIIDKKAREMLE